MKAFFLPLLLLCYQLQAQSVDVLFQEAKKDIEQQDLGAAFKKLERIDSIRPHHPVVISHLLEIAARRQDIPHTLKYLKRSILMDGNPAILEASSYDFLKASPEFEELERFAHELSVSVAGADTAFLLPEKALHPESIAHDGRTGDFFVSSIHQRKILRISAKGHVTDFSSSPILWAVSGLAVDAKEKALWATSCSIPEMQNYSASEEGSCRLIKMSIPSAQIIETYKPGDTLKHHWGDLTIASNGDVFISDSAQPVLYILRKGSGKIEVFKSLDELLNLQGLCFSADEKYLYISDYIKGIYRIDLAKPANMMMVQTPENYLAKGIDGLYFYQQSLIAIQNGVHPFRVAQLTLDESGSEITDFNYLEKGTSRLGEPTLGTVVNQKLYFIANSPWGYYKNGQLDTVAVPQPLILSLSLK